MRRGAKAPTQIEVVIGKEHHHAASRRADVAMSALDGRRFTHDAQLGLAQETLRPALDTARPDHQEAASVDGLVATLAAGPSVTGSATRRVCSCSIVGLSNRLLHFDLAAPQRAVAPS
jgi:hypothetical protein